MSAANVGYTHTLSGMAWLIDLDLAESRQNSSQSGGGLNDDRIVTDAAECRQCGQRAAGADGLCTSCRMDHHGAAIEGRRL